MVLSLRVMLAVAGICVWAITQLASRPLTPPTALCWLVVAWMAGWLVYSLGAYLMNPPRRR
jgi:hypothetical protein